MADPVKGADEVAVEPGPLSFQKAPEPPLPTRAAPAAPAARQPSSFRRQFGIAYIILAAVVGAAVGLTVIMIGKSNETKPVEVAWSGWRPTESGTRGIRQIGRYVGPRYELTKGKQLVGVLGGPMEVQTATGPIPVSAIVVSSGKAGVQRERFDVDYPGAGAFYQLCGSGAGCVIPGKASAERGELVRREALELALYTFRYLPESDHVLVFLPPPPGIQQDDPRYRRVVHFRRNALTPYLSRPLDETLSSRGAPFRPGKLPPNESVTIDRLTTPEVLHLEFSQLGDQSAAAILSPLPA